MSQSTRVGACLSQLKLQCIGSRRTFANPSSLTRVTSLYPLLCAHHETQGAFSERSITSLLNRSYATKPVSRPKAHTGRTTAASKRTPTTSATKAAKKPAPKKTTPKAKPTVKSKAKPRIKAKPKPKKKAKAKPKPKPKRKVLTDAQKTAKADKKKKENIKKLRETALTPPHGTPASAWSVLLAETVKAPGGAAAGALGATSKAASTKFRQLTPEQLEHYNHLANQNKMANQKAYRQFIESYSPLEIYHANLARLNLNRLESRVGRHKRSPLKDDRQVGSYRNSYNYFFTDRHASGDFKGLKVSEAAKLISREWKALSASEKKPYTDKAEQDLARYTQEKKVVLNLDTSPKRRAAAAA